ncbi:hypothetical protein Vi05172_g10733 [Venturia inaequalis]|nr:hypothetical protein Vi05172_g10733 [Venturia inaequalis]
MGALSNLEAAIYHLLRFPEGASGTGVGLSQGR